MKKLFFSLYIFCFSQMLTSCRTGATSDEEQMPVVSVNTSPLVSGNIMNELSFNGNTVYLRKTIVVSPISGYVTRVNKRFGEEVRENDILFEIETRERKALYDKNSPDKDFGVVKVMAASDGYIYDLAVNEQGVFITEGGTLCNIVDSRDLIVRVNVPFEYNPLMTPGRVCNICLSDKSIINGTVFRILPVMDENNQTQTILIKPDTRRQLPENMNVIIKVLNEKHHQAFLVSKSSLMSNETQSEFWIMKIDNDSMAVKIPVIKGIANDSITEIISPLLKVNDLIISEGAYGLPDSTIITIGK